MVTIGQVASLAGVSESTVSRAFAMPDAVKPETRERVLAVARKLNYTPNRIARSLAMGRTRSFGLIVPDIANPFFALIAKSVQARARRKDHTVFLADTDEHETDEVELAEAMAGQVDGLLLVSPRMSDARLGAVVERVPTVLVNRRWDGSPDFAVPSVVVPSEDGIRQAMQHLHALGHTRCCYVAGAAHSWSNERRSAAFRAAGEQLGMDVVELGPYEPRFDAGVRAADLLRAAGATAVIAHNDMVALGVVSRLTERGVSVPGDVSVVGIDDTILASTCTPPLTSVRIPLEDVGRRAVELMVDLVEGHPERVPAVVELGTELIVRRSTGPAAHAR